MKDSTSLFSHSIFLGLRYLIRAISCMLKYYQCWNISTSLTNLLPDFAICLNKFEYCRRSMVAFVHFIKNAKIDPDWAYLLHVICGSFPSIDNCILAIDKRVFYGCMQVFVELLYLFYRERSTNDMSRTMNRGVQLIINKWNSVKIYNFVIINFFLNFFIYSI